ncbi:MAG: B12-binding domain-containing radical SAM protein, partial [bacterium]
MKLLLIQPPIQDFYDTDIRLQPLGLCYLKSVIKKYHPDIQVVIKDYHKGWGRHTIRIPAELSYLKDFYKYPDQSPFSAFYNYYHFGARFETIAEDAAREKPDLVGISANFSPYYREALCCAEEIRQRINVPILAGGAHVSAAPESIIRHPAIDFIIQGEGERPVVEFLKAYKNGKGFDHISNLGFKQDGKLIINPVKDNFPIDELPFPDLSDLGPDRYLFSGAPICFIITSRGCPHHCTFCSVHQTFGRHYRKRDPDLVLKEISLRYEEGYRVFDFEDDNLTFYQDEMKYICSKLSGQFAGTGVRFLAMNGISYMSLNEELLEYMKKAGFSHLNISLVSSNQSVLDNTQRPHSMDKYIEVVHNASRLGFQIVSYQILGLPHEKLESMINTLTLMAELPVLIGASIFYLTP